MNIFLSQTACEIGLNELDVLLAVSLNTEDPLEVSEHIGKLSAVQGYSAKIMGSCEYHKLLNPSPFTKAMYTLSERMNTGLGKSLLAYQSILGKLKEEIRISNYQSK